MLLFATSESLSTSRLYIVALRHAHCFQLGLPYQHTLCQLGRQGLYYSRIKAQIKALTRKNDLELPYFHNFGDPNPHCGHWMNALAATQLRFWLLVGHFEYVGDVEAFLELDC